MTAAIRCLTWGLSAEQRQDCVTAFCLRHPQAGVPDVRPITPSLMTRRVQDVLADWDAAETAEASEPSPAVARRVVLIDTRDPDVVLPLLRSFKSVLPDPGQVAFAMVTPTALGWTFGEYLAHLDREHRHFQTHRPEDDPDMRAF